MAHPWKLGALRIGRPSSEPLEHGTRRMYRGGCRCVPGKAANSEHMREYRAQRKAR